VILDFERSDLREFHGALLEVQGIRLRHRERLFGVVLLFEGRFFGATREEVCECTGEVVDRLLQGLGVDLFQPRQFLFEGRKPVHEVVL
jgi:hypothetical protein